MQHGAQPEHGIDRDKQDHHLRERLLEGVLAAYEREYSTQNAEFAEIDRKAQATITVAGIFLAAVLAFLKQDQLRPLVATSGHYIVHLVGVVVLLLVASILSCAIGMRERWVLGPLKARGYERIVDDLLKLNPQELTSERMANFLRDQVGVWRDAAVTMERALNGKAKWVMWGQLLLIAAIFITAFFFILALYSA